MPTIRTAACALTLLVLLPPAPAAAADAATAAAAPDLPLEELLAIDVQTASRKSQRLQDVAAAVTVITREDIERSGVTTLPELLRLVPGMQVARLANNRWAVSARGFNGRFANKLLVLMDGRSIYSPLFSGVLWEMEDTLLEDIERIEVIRGPGAALWGANAVNGVINIITRQARDTRGGLAVAVAGSQDRAGALRVGWPLAGGHVRLWAKAFEREASTAVDGSPGQDWARGARVGARGDWAFDASRRLMCSAMAYDTPTGDRLLAADLTSPRGFTPIDIRQDNRGANLLARHEWLGAGGSETAVQGYVDHHRVDVAGIVDQTRTTIDLDFQQRVLLGEGHDLVWGLGHRALDDHIDSGGIVRIDPARRSWRLSSVFVHDEITLLPATLKAVAGIRLERNSFTGVEPQPNLRLAWTPDLTQTLWGAISGASRTPSRAELDAQADLQVIPAAAPAPPVLVRNVPDPQHRLDAERVTSVEAGWRRQLGHTLGTDLALFVSRYHKLRSAGAGALGFEPLPLPHGVQTITPRSAGNATVRGAELALDWRPDPRWRWQLAYTHLTMQTEPTGPDPLEAESLRAFEATLPRHQLSLRGGWAASERVRLDGWLRHVAALPGSPAVPRVDAYTTLDLRVAWRPQPRLELSLAGQNLLEARHAEFVPDYLPSQPQWVERALHARLKWQF